MAAANIHHHRNRAEELTLTIYWDTMTWEAAAGFAAVIAAGLVGAGQTMILGQQGKVAEKVAEIEELKLATELYDRRIKVFTAVREVLSYAVMTGKAPGMDRSEQDTPIGVEEFVAFQQGIAASAFLFSEETNREIDKIYGMLSRLTSANRRMRLDDGKEIANARKDRDQVRKEMNDRFLSLADAFHELKLSRG